MSVPDWLVYVLGTVVLGLALVAVGLGSVVYILKNWRSLRWTRDVLRKAAGQVTHRDKLIEAMQEAPAEQLLEKVRAYCFEASGDPAHTQEARDMADRIFLYVVASREGNDG